MLQVLCDVLYRRGLFGSFGRSGSLPDSNVIISYYTGLLAESVEFPAL